MLETVLKRTRNWVQLRYDVRCLLLMQIIGDHFNWDYVDLTTTASTECFITLSHWSRIWEQKEQGTMNDIKIIHVWFDCEFYQILQILKVHKKGYKRNPV